VIVGIGVDIISVKRVNSMLSKYGDRFIERVFVKEEADYCRCMKHSAEHFAARFAAKEAVAKALGTGFGRGVGLKDIAVIRTASGQPRVRLIGGAARAAGRMGVDEVYLTLSHSRTEAIAFAVAEGHVTR